MSKKKNFQSRQLVLGQKIEYGDLPNMRFVCCLLCRGFRGLIFMLCSKVQKMTFQKTLLPLEMIAPNLQHCIK